MSPPLVCLLLDFVHFIGFLFPFLPFFSPSLFFYCIYHSLFYIQHSISLSVLCLVSISLSLWIAFFYAYMYVCVYVIGCKLVLLQCIFYSLYLLYLFKKSTVIVRSLIYSIFISKFKTFDFQIKAFVLKLDFFPM